MSEAPPELNGRQVRHLRSLGNGIEVALTIGRSGLTDAVLVAVLECFNTRELVKIRLRVDDPSARRDLAQELAQRTGTALVQVLGKTALLYRPADADARIESRITLPA